MNKRGLAVAIGVVLAGMVSAVASAEFPRDDTRNLSFGAVSFDPTAFSDWRPATRAPNGAGLRLVQFTDTPQQAWREDLVRSGFVVLQYYPHNAYLVWGDEVAANRTEALPFVRWQGGFSPDWKRSEDLKGRFGTIDNVQMLVYDDGNLTNTIERIRSLGGTVLNLFDAQPDGRLQSLIVRLDAGKLDAVTNIPQVLWAEYASPRAYFEDELASQIVAGNYNGAGQVTATGYIPYITNLGLSGDNVRWAVTDSGIDYANPELTSRIVAGHDFPGCPVTASQPGNDNADGGHGTHVAGIIAGAGTQAGGIDANGFHYGIGIAPQVDLVALNPICIGSVPWPPAGGWQELSKQALARQAIGSNNSWTSGEGTGVGYNASARTHDFMIRDGDFDTAMVNEPFIEVFSAGNSGSGASTITAPKEAKNIIVVGASRNQRVGAIDTLASFSSRGPAIDTRTLPNISAPGEQIASTRRVAGAAQCGTAIGAGVLANYAFCSGTSMASPQVAGLSALLAQWWRNANGGATPSPAMIKSLLVNGAVDMGTADVPNNNEGWGRIHLPRSLANGLQAAYVDQTEVLTTIGAAYERTYGVPASGSPVRVTLTWTDAPGAAGANPALVNNLDLEVIAGGQTYRGNVMTAGQSVTGGTADSRNNIENVFLPAGTSSVTVRVIATTLPGDGVPNVGDTTDQDFALVCSNCISEPTFTVAANPSQFEVCAASTPQVTSTISVGSVLGFVTPVDLTLGGTPAGSTSGLVPSTVTPTGTSTLTIGNLTNITPGTYPVVVTGTSGPTVRTSNIGLEVATALPGASTLQTPADNATCQSFTPTLTWDLVSQGKTYLVEVATDSGFTNIVRSQTLTNVSSWTVTPALSSSTDYFWRVGAANICGNGTGSSVRQFRTQAAAGDCDVGQSVVSVFTNGAEPGTTDGFTVTGSGATNWVTSTARPFAGTAAWLAADVVTVTNQQLETPTINIPSGQNPVTLQFQSDETMEDRTGGGCWDGGWVEYTTNGGTNWTAVPGADVLVGPYNGAVNGVGAGWCGDPLAYNRKVISVSSLAGQAVKFRFRFTSDDSVGRAPHGWYVDDIRVQACSSGPTDAMFANGFE